MSEELGYEVTHKQSLDGLWRTMHKYIERHGYSDISLELEGSQYEFRQHLQKYDEYEAKAKAYNDTLETLDKLINNDERYKEARSNDFVAGMLLAYEKTSILMEDYIKENGGYYAKK